MTKLEDLLKEQQTIIEKQQKWVRKLLKRLKEKKKYELQFLINTSCTPQYIADIDAKDKRAMEEPT